MSTCVVVCLGLLASSPDSSAEALIRQALECEAKGQYGERQRLLELAVQADPASPTARGLLGQVKVDDQWLDPDQAAGREQSDEQRAALLARVRGEAGRHPGYGRGTLEARSLVRAARAEGRVDCPPDAGHPPRSRKPRGLAAPRLPLVSRPLDERRADCRHRGRPAKSEPRRSPLASLCLCTGKPGSWTLPDGMRPPASFPRSTTRAPSRRSLWYSTARPVGSGGRSTSWAGSTRRKRPRHSPSWR